MWSRRSCWLALFVATATLAVAPAAVAHHHPDHACSGGTNIGGGTGEAGAECDASPGGGGAPAPECDPDSRDIAWYGDPPQDLSDEEADRWLTLMLRYGDVPEGKTWQAAFNCAGVYLGGPYLVDDPDWPAIEGIREEARARVTPPLPVPNVSPAETVVNLPTWLWVDEAEWQPAEATEIDGAVTVRVQARPVRVTWDLIEGTRTCDGPGIPWSRAAHDAYEAQPEDVRGRGNPACTFTFVHSSTTQPDDVYRASVTVAWEFSWWLNGTARGVFGTVDRTTDFDLRVGEIQALITDY